MTEQELDEKLGKELDSSGFIAGTWKNEANVVYVSGIPEFDKILSPYKFEETDCIISAISFENGIIFSLTLNNLNVFFTSIIVWRQNIISFDFKEDVIINVPKFNRFKDAFNPIGGGGLGAIIATSRRIKSQQKKRFKVIGVKQKSGTQVNLSYHDEVVNKNRNVVFYLSDYFSKIFFKNQLFKSKG